MPENLTLEQRIQKTGQKLDTGLGSVLRGTGAGLGAFLGATAIAANPIIGGLATGLAGYFGTNTVYNTAKKGLGWAYNLTKNIVKAPFSEKTYQWIGDKYKKAKAWTQKADAKLEQYAQGLNYVFCGSPEENERRKTMTPEQKAESLKAERAQKNQVLKVMGAESAKYLANCAANTAKYVGKTAYKATAGILDTIFRTKNKNYKVEAGSGVLSAALPALLL